MKNTLRKLLALVLCFMLVAALAMSNGLATTVTEETNTAVATEEVEIHWFLFNVYDIDGNEIYSNFIFTDQTSVGAALLAYRMIEGEESAYGLYVKTIFGITADYNVDQTYWAFYINGEYAMTGVDATVIEDGSVYTFSVAK